MPLRDFPCRDTAVDLGSRTARVHVRGRGVLAVTPSLLATCAKTGRCLAVGERAAELRAEVPGDVHFTWPFEGGVPADPEPVQWMLRYLLREVHGRRHLANPRMALAVPSQITDLQQYALAEAAGSAGARWTTMVPAPLAAALGAGLPMDEPHAVMVVDLGAVMTDIAVMSLGTIVAARTVRVGGRDLDRAIVAHVRRNKNVLLGVATAGAAKRRIGADGQWGYGRSPLLLHGRDPHNGLPRPVLLTSADIATAIAGPLERIMEAIRATLADCPPEMVRDLASDGATLTGGGARLCGLTTLLRTRTGLPARVPDDPSSAVVLGAAAHLERSRAFSRRTHRRDRHRGFLSAPRRL